MPKRKREDEKDQLSQKLSPIARHLQSHLTQSTHALHSALKLARGFERQKLGRRLKNAAEEIKPRLNNEVAILKKLDLGIVAEDHIFKVMGRIKRVREHEIFQECTKQRGEAGKAKGEKPEEGKGSEKEAMNVKGRLFKTLPAARSIEECVQGVYAVLGLGEGDRKISDTRAEGSNVKITGDFVSKQSKEASALPAKTIDTNTRHDDTAAKHDSNSDEDEDSALDQFATRLASISNASSPGPVSRSSTPLSSQSLPKAKTNLTPPPGSTTFLPSLSQHGYISDSASEASSVEGDQPKRRNRLGQKQRQMIAERKYGRNANHIREERESGRDAGWDKRAGAVDKAQPRRWGRGRGRGHEGSQDGSRGFKGYGRGGTYHAMHSADMNAFSRGGRMLDSKPLHPSWAAAQKRKEDAASWGAKATFQGKKVVFN